MKINKKIVLSITLFLIIILVLGIPFYQWGFKNDDWSNLNNCIIKSYKDILNYFTQGNIECLYNPSNVDSSIKIQSFLQGLFRPLSFIYYLPQYFLFSTHAYGYYLTTIIFHALDTVILFNIFANFISIFFAFFASLFFAFHPSLWNWLGWTSAQTYQIELFVFLISILFLKKYLDSGKISFYLISCTLFTANLFLKEQTIVFPFWVIFAIYFYEKTKNIKNVKFALKISIGYWLVALFYLITRASMFPINSNAKTFNCELNVSSFLNRLIVRVFDFVTYIADMLMLTWLPKNHQIINGLIILIFIIIFLILFIKNTIHLRQGYGGQEKIYILFLLFSTIIFSWPAILIQYQPRYIYMSIPFFILSLIILISYSELNFNFIKNKKFLYALLTATTILFALFLYNKLKLREKVLNHITVSFKELINNNTIQNQIKNKKPLCFIALPPYWFDMGTAQAMWFLTKDNSYPVYHFGAKIVEKNRHSYREIPQFNKNYLKVTLTKTDVEIESLNPELLWFYENNIKLSKTKINIPQKYLSENPIFITWDYEKANFKILDFNAKDLCDQKIIK